MRMKNQCCEAAINAMIDAGLDMKKEKALKELYALYDKYGIEYQRIFQKFIKQIKGKIDYRIIAYGIIAYRKMIESYLSPYTKVIPTLISLKKNYNLAVITDAQILEAWMRLVTMKIDNFFDVVITKGDVRKQKNTVAPFKAAIKALNIKPQEAIMVGDRIARDVQTAKKLGIHTAYARYGDIRKAEKGKSGAEYELEDISQLIKIADSID